MINPSIQVFTALNILKRDRYSKIEPVRQSRQSKQKHEKKKTKRHQSNLESKPSIVRVVCDYCEATTSDLHRIGFSSIRFFAESESLCQEEIEAVVQTHIPDSISDAASRLRLDTILLDKCGFLQLVMDNLNRYVSSHAISCAASGISDIFVDDQIERR
jgi:hypothetical protein